MQTQTQTDAVEPKENSDTPKESTTKERMLNLLAALIGFVFIVGVVFGLEAFCRSQLKKTNDDAPIPLFGALSKTGKFQRGRSELAMSIMDPLTGYRRDYNLIPGTKEDEGRLAFIDTFVVYLRSTRPNEWMKNPGDRNLRFTPELVAKMERPIIVTLGGSATDPGYKYSSKFTGNSSWPEELSKQMDEKNLPGTVINAGMSGYTSAQELLILIRDVLEMNPDIVVSYSGYNDLFQGVEGHPYHHKYQKTIFNFLQKAGNPLPNTTTYLSGNAGKEKTFYGIENTAPAHENVMKNWSMMKAICDTRNIRFYAVLQPISGGSEESEADAATPRIAKYITMREVIRENLSRLDYLRDFSSIFDDRDPKDIYVDDCHVTLDGNQTIAKSIFEMLFDGESAESNRGSVGALLETVTNWMFSKMAAANGA